MVLFLSNIDFLIGVWADDDSVVVNNVTDTSKRDFYLGIYGALGIGQGKFRWIYWMFNPAA